MQESILSAKGFSSFEAGSASIPQIVELRKKAFQAFLNQGLPTTRDEDWKYTSLSVLEKANFLAANTSSLGSVSKDQIEQYLLSDLSKTCLVFVDGAFSSELSSVVEQEGLTICSIKALASSPAKATFEKYFSTSVGAAKPLFSLNTAYVADGAFVQIKKGVKLAQPIHLVFLCSGVVDKATNNARVLIVAEENSKAEIIESYVGLKDSEYLTSNVTEVFLEKSASVHHYRIVREAKSAIHISNLEAHQESNSRFLTHAFNFDGKLIRADINSVLDGEGIFTGLYGLNVLSADQHIDNSTVLDHAKPHCESDEQYRGIYADKSRGIFSGTIIVRPDAQKTNAIQSNQSVLLSDQAESNSRPQLKIWADDVKCTHGATVGQLDDNALFYLRARGIPKIAARNILVHAFASDVVNQVEHKQMRDYLESLVDQKLANEVTTIKRAA